MGLGTPAAPQPGLWPFMISCVMVVLGLFQLIIGRHNRDAEKFTRMSMAPLTGLVTLAAMVALMPAIGFELPALVLCIIWMRFLGGETWRSTLWSAPSSWRRSTASSSWRSTPPFPTSSRRPPWIF